MLYSKTAHQTGGSGFFFNDDKLAPADAIAVDDADVQIAINLPVGSTYDFDSTRRLTTTAPSAAVLLAQAQSMKIATLASACAAQIYAGFTSSALGTDHTYPTNDKDQVNLSASVTASLIPNLPANWTTDFWCADSAGVWALRPHTAAQIQQAGMDGKMAIETAIRKNATLAAQVMAAATVAEAQAVVW